MTGESSSRTRLVCAALLCFSHVSALPVPGPAVRISVSVGAPQSLRSQLTHAVGTWQVWAYICFTRLPLRWHLRFRFCLVHVHLSLLLEGAFVLDLSVRLACLESRRKRGLGCSLVFLQAGPYFAYFVRRVPYRRTLAVTSWHLCNPLRPRHPLRPPRLRRSRDL